MVTPYKYLQIKVYLSCRGEHCSSIGALYNWKPFRQPTVATFPIREGKWLSSTGIHKQLNRAIKLHRNIYRQIRRIGFCKAKMLIIAPTNNPFIAISTTKDLPLNSTYRKAVSFIYLRDFHSFSQIGSSLLTPTKSTLSPTSFKTSFIASAVTLPPSAPT